MKRIFLLGLFLTMICCAQKRVQPLTLTSKDFKSSAEISRRYGCNGQDYSPSLSWRGGPEGVKSWALIVDDPDAPKQKEPWVHWIVFNLSPQVRDLPVAADISQYPPAIQGITSFNVPGYKGPCPPDRAHRYYFKLYALDTMLELGSGARKADLEKAMEGHILAESILMGRYPQKK